MLTAEEKIWVILGQIFEKRKITTRGTLIRLNGLELQELMTRQDYEQIVEKLQKDHKAIEVRAMPDYIVERDVMLYTLPAFDKLYEKYRRTIGLAQLGDAAIVFNNLNGDLSIRNYQPIKFDGLRRQIVGFFYNSKSRKTPKTYDDIKKGVGEINSKEIKKAIQKINERVSKATQTEIPSLIESFKDEGVGRDHHLFRWGL